MRDFVRDFVWSACDGGDDVCADGRWDWMVVAYVLGFRVAYGR